MNSKSFALAAMAIVLVSGMVMVSACTNANNTTKQFNQSDNNTTVEIKSGETFKVILDENPTTGYSWNVSATSGMTIVNSTYIPQNSIQTAGNDTYSPPGILVGAGGLHVWEIKAAGTGDQQFTGIYRRPFEPLFGNETTYSLNVKII
jgi:Predicted secreted protein